MPNTDDLKGRAQEAVGDLTDDEGLQREGKVDQAKGKAKEKLDDVADKVKGAVNRDR
ncbi:MAG: CsbD family protein [Acidimicrobiales bacterium]